MEVNLQADLAVGLDMISKKAEAAIENLKKMGFNLIMAKPQIYDEDLKTTVDCDGEIPVDLTALSDRELGKHLGKLSSWITFINTHLSISNVRWVEAKTKMEFAEAKIRLSIPKSDADGKITNPDRDARVQTDLRYLSLKTDFQYWDGIVSYLKPMLESAQQRYAAVSRRISQRHIEVAQHNRGNSAEKPQVVDYGSLSPRPTWRGNQ